MALAALTLALVGNSYAARNGQERAQWWRTHTLDVLIDAERIDTALNKALRGERGYVLTGRPGALATFKQGLADYRLLADRLRALTHDSRSQQRRLVELDRRVRAFAAVSAPIMTLMQVGKSGSAIAAARVGGEREALENASAMLDEVKREERRLLAIREAASAAAAARSLHLEQVIIWLDGALLLMIAGAVVALLRARSTADHTAMTLAKNEQLYRLLADHSNDMIVRIGLDGVRRYVSPASQSLLGYAPEEMVGGTPVAAIHPDDRARVMDVCQSLLAGVDDPICSYRQQHRDGHYIWLEATYRLIRDAAGVPTEFVASVRDIRRRQSAELAVAEASADLQESHRLFTMAASLARVGHWRLDLVGGELAWSAEVYRIHDKDVDWVPDVSNAIELYHPDDRDRVSRYVDRAVTLGESFDFTATLLLGDGSTKPVAARGQAERAPNGEVVGLIGVIQDIGAQVAAQEALRESEQQYRLLADNASDVVLRTADDGSVLYISPSCVDLSGYRPDELVGRPCADFIHEDDYRPVHAAHVAIITGQRDAVTIQYRLKQKQGGWRWLESHMKPWQQPDGSRAGVISAIRDIEARKALEAELVTARDSAEAAVRAKATFLANMSHEIRTPMNGVVGFTELLLAGELLPEQRRRAELIADSGRSMVRLLNDILDLSKIEAGQMSVCHEPFDLPHTLNACVKLVKPAVEQKGVRLECDLSTALPTMVLGDGLRVRQIVLNLLGNAAKFTSAGTITLRARFVRQADGPCVVIEVQDTGIGIPSDRQAAIFERFVQADAAVAPTFGGTGLGLPISVQLARLMGGAVALESELGRGSCFIVTLPLEPASAAPATEIREATDPGPTPALPSALRVLVAEDHDVNQLLIAEMLGQLGCVADIANDGEEALSMIAAADRCHRPYSIVLMDLQMPRLGGLDATRRLRSSGYTPNRLPVVALTANAYADDVATCLDAGMQAHLAKPLELRDLESALRRWAIAPIAPQPRDGSEFSVKVRERYRLRREETLNKVDELVRLNRFEDAAIREVADLLHKLAGTAGMFGDVELGERAGAFEHGLLTWPVDLRDSRARAMAAALRDAA